jgi:2-hydroxychromene-2-carboxylate isomerase
MGRFFCAPLRFHGSAGHATLAAKQRKRAMASAEFWYEFASTYSYPAALRIGSLAEERGVSVVWRPFLLGPIFAAQGWRDSPFNIYPAKGRYMWRDLERVCGAMGVPLKRPEPFPQPSLLAARVALALEGDQRSNFSRQVYIAEFGRGLPIADRATLAALLAACGADPEGTLERAGSDANKALLKAECARAVEIGVVGAPCVVTEDGEVFWGNDRLEQGLDWAARARDGKVL